MKYLKHLIQLIFFVVLLFVFIGLLNDWQRKAAFEVYQEMIKGSWQTEKILKQKNKILRI